MDKTSCALRPPHVKSPATLFGADEILRVMSKVLVDSRTGHVASSSATQRLLLPVIQIVMLYGRKGSGKNTLLHHEKDGERIFFAQFARVMDWKMRSWNASQFVLWCHRCVQCLEEMDRQGDNNNNNNNNDASYPRGPGSLLILVENIHQLNYLRSGDVVDAFVHLLTTVRCCRTRRNDIRVVLTCDESPGQFPSEIRSLVDAHYLMPLPGPADRKRIALDLMKTYRECISTMPHMIPLVWDVSLDDADIESDPNHVLNVFAIQSTGTTPYEIHYYMARSFSACYQPRENGTTEYGPALFDILKYDVDGIACITPYNPMTKNAPIYSYADINPETRVHAGVGTVVLSDQTTTMSALPDHAQEKDCKRAKTDQPTGIADAIEERVKQQELLLKKASKAESLKRKKPE